MKGNNKKKKRGKKEGHSPPPPPPPPLPVPLLPPIKKDKPGNNAIIHKKGQKWKRRNDGNKKHK